MILNGNSDEVNYIHKDHLGSWTTFTDSIGGVIKRQRFDAWGNKRVIPVRNDAYEPPHFDRGFTGHEHLYEFGLINMNGRMYDPMSASFLSPDSYIQDPTTQQGFNRYAYCAYNPLKYVDPSGELYFGWVNIEYMIEQEIKHKCREEQYRLYEIVTSTHELTMFMAGTLFSLGMDDFGNGSGNHGSPGGGGSVEVKPIGNGKYEVVKGMNDGGNTVYVVDDQGNRTGEILGYTLTPYTFYNQYGNIVTGATIDLNDYSGQNFLDDFVTNPPGIITYMQDIIHGDNGTDISLYNFKVFGYDSNRDNYDTYIYRSMSINYGDGVYIASARDIGNFVAGYLCGINGITYSMTRIAFDGYQYYRYGNIEPPVSQLAQDCGYHWGRQLFSKIIQIPFYY